MRPLILALVLLLAPPARAEKKPFAPFLGRWAGDQDCPDSAARVGVGFKETKSGYEAIFNVIGAEKSKNGGLHGRVLLKPEGGKFQGELELRGEHDYSALFRQLAVQRLLVQAVPTEGDNGARSVEFTVRTGTDSYREAGFELRGLASLTPEKERADLDYYLMLRTPFQNPRRCEGSLSKR